MRLDSKKGSDQVWFGFRESMTMVMGWREMRMKRAEEFFVTMRVDSSGLYCKIDCLF